jgi:signal transduction histidine kinase
MTSRPIPVDLVLAGLLAIPAFLWALLAYNLWVFPRSRVAPTQLVGLFRFFPAVSTVIALYYNQRVEPLARIRPTGAAADALPARAFIAVWLNDARLREALIEADVVAVVPVRSPRQPWGHLFISTDLLGWAKGAEALETLESFAARLALVLDAAELLARAVAVERSLAHAEKLAAIGETAARVVHEIRNPVTAARSLAQQLRREPTSPLNAEHADLIVTELERVERQVGALLRFARREEFRYETLDAGELVRATAESFRPRLKEAGIEVAVAAADGVLVRADREKVRQVLVNLIENAIDALAEGGERRLSLAVSGANGTATLRVADTGPGVPADALPHLFEPFFSLKAHGTGLGLAIARRTIEAHGGRIEATNPPAGGMAFRIELPLVGPLG